jgi:hypothetical protein
MRESFCHKKTEDNKASKAKVPINNKTHEERCRVGAPETIGSLAGWASGRSAEGGVMPLIL